MPILNLVINPGQTSTKIAVFEDENQVFVENIRHKSEEIDSFPSVAAQKGFRERLVLESLEKHGINVYDLDCVTARGGDLKPISGGTYIIDDDLVRDSIIGPQGHHPSNVGAIIADEIAKKVGIPAYTVDPPTVDELSKISKYSGCPEIKKTSLMHALNQKAIAKRYAKETGRKYEELNLIICHMGGGISVCAHKNGLICDAQNALTGGGPFTPQRSGSLPWGPVVELCFSGKYTEKEIEDLFTKKSGLLAYTGIGDVRTITEKAIAGDEVCEEAMEAFHYGIAKEIGALATVFDGKVDQIIFTGGIAFSEYTISALKKKIGWIAPVSVYPGEDEMRALCEGALRVINGLEEAKKY